MIRMILAISTTRRRPDRTLKTKKSLISSKISSHKRQAIIRKTNQLIQTITHPTLCMNRKNQVPTKLSRCWSVAIQIKNQVFKDLFKKYSGRECKFGRKASWNKWHCLTNSTSETLRMSQNSASKYLKTCLNLSSKEWSTTSTYRKFRPTSKTLQEHFWSSGSLMSIENSDYSQKLCMWPCSSSTNTWVANKFKRISCTWLAWRLCGFQRNTKKYIRPTWINSCKLAKTNLAELKFCRWRRTFFRNWTSWLLCRVPTGSCRGTGDCQVH